MCLNNGVFPSEFEANRKLCRAVEVFVKDNTELELVPVLMKFIVQDQTTGMIIQATHPQVLILEILPFAIFVSVYLILMIFQFYIIQYGQFRISWAISLSKTFNSISD